MRFNFIFNSFIHLLTSFNLLQFILLSIFDRTLLSVFAKSCNLLMISCPTLHWQWLVQSGGQILGDTANNVCISIAPVHEYVLWIIMSLHLAMKVLMSLRVSEIWPSLLSMRVASNKGAPSFMLLYLCLSG